MKHNISIRQRTPSPPIIHGVENERDQVVIWVLLIDQHPQGVLMHIHIILHLLRALMLNVTRRVNGRAQRRPCREPPISLIGMIRVVGESSGVGVGVIAGIVPARVVVGVSWRRRVRRIRMVRWRIREIIMWGWWWWGL